MHTNLLSDISGKPLKTFGYDISDMAAAQMVSPSGFAVGLRHLRDLAPTLLAAASRSSASHRTLEGFASPHSLPPTF
jgi:hypothetical protein